MGRRILCLIVYSLCRDIGLNFYDLSLFYALQQALSRAMQKYMQAKRLDKFILYREGKLPAAKIVPVS